MADPETGCGLMITLVMGVIIAALVVVAIVAVLSNGAIT